MNKRQRAKATTGKQANPLLEAWNVVAEHLVGLKATGDCFFVDRTGYSRDSVTLQLSNCAGFKIVSKPIRRA